MWFFAKLLDFFGFSSADHGSQACAAFWLDEPECPKSLIK